MRPGDAPLHLLPVLSAVPVPAGHGSGCSSSQHLEAQTPKDGARIRETNRLWMHLALGYPYRHLLALV